MRASYDALDPAEREEMTFPQYLDDCLGKNGALVEILTDDTPRGYERDAVSLYRVQYSDDPDDIREEYLCQWAYQELTEYCAKVEKI